LLITLLPIQIYGWEPQPFGINGDGKYDANLLKTQLDDKSKETPPMPETLKNYILERVKSSPGKVSEYSIIHTFFLPGKKRSFGNFKNVFRFAFRKQTY